MSPAGVVGGAGSAGPGGADGAGAAAGPAPSRPLPRVLDWGTTTIGLGGPAVAVSLTGPTLAQARQQAARAMAAGADVLELRVDLLEPVRKQVAEAARACGASRTGGHVQEAETAQAARAAGVARVVLEAVEAVGAVVPEPPGSPGVPGRQGGGAPVLLTCRTAAEGGRADINDAFYEALLLAVVEGAAGLPAPLRPVAVDVELERGCLERVARAAHVVGTDVVASFHDVTATPGEAVLEDVLERMVAQGADLAKVAVWPTDAVDVARLLTVTARARLPVPVAAMSMGALGAVTRVAAAFGSALTFAVVPDEEGRAEPSAPGQLPLAEVRRCLALLGGR
ncbi:type I 3-dehydroquinate dehydratase [Actinomyces wuliandei]|uniref:type I 3-dehydroquinate dehydratase n=1 Tax=Actinomyces wuliandei TaxID=2057743 RepID=UPI001FA95AAE|nr:type I 3-dehydroquinate dehydratase [Actinomyces wuliandei]